MYGRKHKRLMKFFAPASEEDTVRILHVASNCGPLLSDMNVNEYSCCYYSGVMVVRLGTVVVTSEAFELGALES